MGEVRGWRLVDKIATAVTSGEGDCTTVGIDGDYAIFVGGAVQQKDVTTMAVSASKRFSDTKWNSSPDGQAVLYNIHDIPTAFEVSAVVGGYSQSISTSDWVQSSGI